jgi:flagellar motor protein MotB
MRAVTAGCAIGVLACLIQAGCAQSPYALQSQVSSLQSQQTALAQRNQELQSRATTLDQDNQDLHTQLAQSERQSRLMQDQTAALREQLASTTAQLAQSQQDKQLVERNAQAIVASTKRRAGVTISPNSSLAQNLPAINLPGVFVRQDGDVVRIEISADQLFEPGGAQLRPDSVTLLDAIAAEIERTYPDQIIGIEGHTDDNSPPAPWTSFHQFTMGRAMAVFDYLSTRTRLKPNQLFLVGHGKNHPVVSNATPAGQARNRRIELVVYPDRVGQ